MDKNNSPENEGQDSNEQLTPRKRARVRITRSESQRESCIVVGSSDESNGKAEVLRRTMTAQPKHEKNKDAGKEEDPFAVLPLSIEEILRRHEEEERKHQEQEESLQALPHKNSTDDIAARREALEKKYNYPYARLSEEESQELKPRPLRPYVKEPKGREGAPLKKVRSPKNNTNKRQKKGLAIQPAPKEVVSYPEAKEGSTESIRLNKFLANAGVCARRKADELILEGKVTVNGEVVTTLGCQVTRQDEICCEGKVVSIERKIYVLLNKPRNCVTTSDDPEKRLTVMDIVRNACKERIYSVGRLDRNTTGVLLLTNDGDIATKLTHPSYSKKKIYQVTLDKPVLVEHMQQIAEGIELEDGEIHADALSYINDEDLSQVGIEIHSGRNRIVRRIFEHFGYKVLKLDRVYYAGLTKKDLPRGRWRYLTELEVRNLRMDSYE